MTPILHVCAGQDHSTQPSPVRDHLGGRAPSGTLWITTGELAGHYVILSDGHYLMEGYQEAPPASYDGLEPLDSRTWGTKTGFVGQAITCDFVSRWVEKGADGTFSVVGPITIPRTGNQLPPPRGSRASPVRQLRGSSAHRARSRVGRRRITDDTAVQLGRQQVDLARELGVRLELQL